jgi:uncharacterized phage-associated protein
MADTNVIFSAHDVAAYILKHIGKMTAMKLEKLVYYCQAWSLVWDERPLFGEEIQAWANGPVIPDLYCVHRGMFYVDEWAQGNPDALDADASETVDIVLDFYGPKSPQWLSDLTHMELPWREARHGLTDDERGSNEITIASMAEYYGGL